ncbi:MAG: DNA polymerase IV [Desulfobulbaceae bacterium]|nr:DNA polymerase IV [Desulfobulbaceae bacterium]
MLKAPRSIIHLDMDAFFASVETLDNPGLRGKPVIVGGGELRGVVSAASYEARRFGVHSALPMMTARARCPQGIFLPPRMARYREVSAMIMTIFQRYTPLVEPLSLDEAFLDVTGTERLFGSAADLAATIRAQVRTEVGLTVSAGVASSKLLAKIASDRQKPDGLTVVTVGSEVDFLTPLPIAALPGVGSATMKQLELLGVRTIGDLARLPVEILVRKLGQQGSYLHEAAQGVDRRPVEAERVVKSVGNEETFAEDIVDMVRIRKELLALAVKVANRLRVQGVEARTIVLKTKYYDFVQTTRSQTLAAATADDEVLYQAGCALLTQTLAGRKPLRLMGLTAMNLLSSGRVRPALLFDGEDCRLDKRRKINQAVDQINDNFGRRTIMPATLLNE